MFLGTYQTRFTGRGRVILPKIFRSEVKGLEVILTRGLDGCIWGFVKSDWEREVKRQLEISITTLEGRSLRRYIFSSAAKVSLDRQGRFVIPDILLNFAKIKDEVSVIGAGDHFEIWNSKEWQRTLRASSSVL